jgi:biopolymer transport protein ExbD
MPVPLQNRLTAESDARIEIVPLIDIMFFLLASFMLVSLSLIDARAMGVKLPAAAHAEGQDAGKNILAVAVDKSGTAYFENAPVSLNELAARLSGVLAARPDAKVLVSGDRDARHGDIVRVLDALRGAKALNVALSTAPEGGAR